MSLICTNPSVFQGNPGNPPEYASDNDAACAKCRQFIDLDDEPHKEMADGSILCMACVGICAGCGEFVLDIRASVTMRCPATGKLQPWCAACAANDWLQRLLDYRADALVDFDPLSAAHIKSIDVDTLQKPSLDALWAFYGRKA